MEDKIITKIEEKNGESFLVFYKNDIEFYWIDKGRCCNDSQLIDWIDHLSQKRWWTPELQKNLMTWYKKIKKD